MTLGVSGHFTKPQFYRTLLFESDRKSKSNRHTQKKGFVTWLIELHSLGGKLALGRTEPRDSTYVIGLEFSTITSAFFLTGFALRQVFFCGVPGSVPDMEEALPNSATELLGERHTVSVLGMTVPWER